MLDDSQTIKEKVVYFLDLATYHRSHVTKEELKRLGLNVLYNSPENPCLNMIELFIRAAQATIKMKRSTVR